MEVGGETQQNGIDGVEEKICRRDLFGSQPTHAPRLWWSPTFRFEQEPYYQMRYLRDADVAPSAFLSKGQTMSKGL